MLIFTNFGTEFWRSIQETIGKMFTDDLLLFVDLEYSNFPVGEIM